MATVVATTVDTSKNSVRTHQILSRETSFVSKPVSTEEKDETTAALPAVATPQVTVAPQITVPTIATTATAATTVTITSKFRTNQHFEKRRQRTFELALLIWM